MRTKRSNPGVGSGGPRYPGSFLLAFRKALADAGWQEKAWTPHAVASLDSQGREQVVGLENLFRRLRHEPRSSWVDLVAEFLRSIPTEGFPELPASLREVTEQLLVRLGPEPNAKNAPDGGLWHHSLLPKILSATLVIDFPNTMSYVTSKLLEASGEDAEYWIEAALDNLAERTPPDWTTSIHTEVGLCQATVSDAYDSSRALLLERLFPDQAEHGFFVIIPGRDLMLFAPVSAASMAHVPGLKAIALRNFHSAPYPISPEVFWLYSGRWHTFAVSMEGDQISVQPPPEFRPVLDKFMPPLEDAD